jgi:hypothetical protein
VARLHPQRHRCSSNSSLGKHGPSLRLLAYHGECCHLGQRCAADQTGKFKSAVAAVHTCRGYEPRAVLARSPVKRTILPKGAMYQQRMRSALDLITLRVLTPCSKCYGAHVLDNKPVGRTRAAACKFGCCLSRGQQKVPSLANWVRKREDADGFDVVLATGLLFSALALRCPQAWRHNQASVWRQGSAALQGPRSTSNPSARRQRVCHTQRCARLCGAMPSSNVCDAIHPSRLEGLPTLVGYM